MSPVNVTADAEQFTSNVYLVDGEVTTLVDAGAMPGVVDEIRTHVDDLDRVVLTHQHGDHVEQLDSVLDAFDADLFAYDDHPRRTHVIDDGDELQIGDETHEVVYTPGHAADHVAFVGETALFSGDVVVYNDGAFDDGSFGRTDHPTGDRERLIESLRTILDRLPDSVTGLYAGHGDPFEATAGESVRDVIERALERAERREPKYPDE
ncbi:hydroxyacylglutathione hydrolase [Halolamina pelagica]|uniref:Hydroxyacylglutathione hydrolase n=1 Tax=Halolamina pelagica TaxID=699431 RepID=A0A0P7GLB8_9EURY|nr:MBL fold metallo-hydrolase [Halolamina pelagica]KPN29322.1 hydroxyacylglutathione hydrolase [Halolamina pelagica]